MDTTLIQVPRVVKRAGHAVRITKLGWVSHVSDGANGEGSTQQPIIVAAIGSLDKLTPRV